MGKVVVTQFMSIDGVFQDPGGVGEFEHGGWSFKFDRGAEGNQFKVDELMASDALLLGRVTWEGFAKAWPGREDEAGFARKFNSMPKYVVSATMQEADWTNSTIISADLPSEVAKLKERHDGDLVVHGSGQLVRGLMEHDLVDQYNLMTFPVVLGTGKRLFTEGSPTTTLRLVESRPVGPDGVLVLIYQRAG